ncbi:protein EARLY-RESPONSIVE TO DEHYDRATION 7, chloroplastic-like [Wolffia australiana]
MESSSRHEQGFQRGSLYPEVEQSRSDLNPPVVDPSANSRARYPSIEMNDFVENLFPGVENPNLIDPPVEEKLVVVPGAILHLIDRQHSVELGSGDFSISRLVQGENVIAVIARVGDVVQWPLAKDEAAVRLDHSHYFFSLHVLEESLQYGLTFASKGQESLLETLDGVLAHYTSFSFQKVETKAEVLDESLTKETSPGEVTAPGPKKETIERLSSAYWTTLAPNVEDYSGAVPKAIARGSGQLIKGILWCGEVTVDRLNKGNEVLKSRLSPNSKPAEISEQALRRMKRVKKVTKMSEKVAGGVLSGALKVSGFFTSSLVNSKAGKKFFNLLPGEIVLASLDGFTKVGDAVEAVGKNVLSTSSTVTTELVSHKYGEEAGKLTNEGLHATGHAMGAAWAVFKIRQALNPKNSIKPTSIVKSAAKAAAAASNSKAKVKQ